MLPGYRTFRLFGNSAFARATPFVPDGVAICFKGCSHFLYALQEVSERIIGRCRWNILRFLRIVKNEKKNNNSSLYLLCTLFVSSSLFCSFYWSEGDANRGDGRREMEQSAPNHATLSL